MADSETPSTPFDELFPNAGPVPEFLAQMLEMVAATKPEDAEKMSRWLAMLPANIGQVAAMPIVSLLKKRGGIDGISEEQDREMQRLFHWFAESVERIHILMGVIIGELVATFPADADVPTLERIPRDEFLAEFERSAAEGKAFCEKNGIAPPTKFEDPST